MISPDDFDPEIGVPLELEPGLQRIVAPNPSPMTYRGTNTYLLGQTGVAVIDPGPKIPTHLDAILQALGPKQHISHIIVTHSHLDHSPLARPLSDATGAPVLAYGGAGAGRSIQMIELAQNADVGGGEGVDLGFEPDVCLADGEVIHGAGWSLETLHTPGHIGNHICLAWGDRCFTADHVMGWASSLVSPPDGDLSDFMKSCSRLQQRSWRVFYPGHGDLVARPMERLEWLISHRKSREAEVLATLQAGPATAMELARVIYHQTPDALLPAASRNVLAHLIDLMSKSEVSLEGPLSVSSRFSRQT